MLNGLTPESATGLAAEVEPVVADVAQPAKDHALREALRTFVISRPELPEQGHQRVAGERVHLVEQEDERARIVLRPAPEHAPQRAAGADRLQGVLRERLHRVVTERVARLLRERPEDERHRAFEIAADGLGRLDARVEAAEVSRAASVQEVPERQQRAGLPGLPRRVEDEVLLLPDELEDPLGIHPIQRRNQVVLLRLHRPDGVEEAHPAKYHTPAPGGGGVRPPDLIEPRAHATGLENGGNGLERRLQPGTAGRRAAGCRAVGRDDGP